MIKPEAFPLHWPYWWPRTKPHHRKHSRYEVTFGKALDDLQRELHAGGARAIVLSSNLPVKANGEPYATYREPADPGVALWYIDRAGVSRVIPCDTWKTARENLRAIGLCYSGVRLIERTGANQLADAALDRFKALPPAPDPAREHWADVLGFPTVKLGQQVTCIPAITRAQIEARFRQLSLTMHPDRGGDQAAFSIVTAAYHEGMKETPL